MKPFYLSSILLIFQLSTTAQEKISINQLAPTIQFEKCLNEKLDSGFYKNKFLVIDFWATWCAPCIAGFPHFNELSKKFSSKDIVFASISDENEKTVRRFFDRTKKQLLALKLIDTTRKTSKEYEIYAIPSCIIIDRNNILKWKGQTYELTESLLDSILQNKYLPAAANISLKQKKEESKPITERALFSFSVALSDTSKQSYEGGGYSAKKDNEFITLSRANTRLGDFLKEITGFSKAVRFITNDSNKLKRMIDVYFELKNTDSALFSEMKNKYIANSVTKNLILDLLSKSLNFSIEPVKKETTFYNLIIADSVKLHSFISMQEHHSSWSDDFPPQLEIVRYSLNDIAVFLESEMSVIIKMNINDNNKYDLSLNISSMNELNKRLLFHGLELKESKGEVNMLNIIFH